MVTKCLGNCGKFEQPDGTWEMNNPEPENTDTYYDSSWCPECHEIEMEKIAQFEIS